MRQIRSDIFEAYAELAEKKGLVKMAAEDKKDKESSELKKYKTDANPRVGSDDISTIEALYGVKPQAIPGMEYERNIIEIAHPNAVVVSPAYDKINGLVENLNEQADIIRNKIMSKAPSGSVFLLKDAEKELSMELIRIGNDMDNANEEEIRVLADECLAELSKNAGWWDDATDFVSKKVKDLMGGGAAKITDDAGSVGKGALEGAAAGAAMAAIISAWSGPFAAAPITLGALTGALVGGLGAYLLNTGSKVRNIKENTASLLNQLEDLKKSVPEEANFFVSIENICSKIVKASDAYLAALEVIRSKREKNEVTSEAEINEIKKDAKEFVALIDIFDKIVADFDAKDKEGAFAKALNKIPGLDNDIQDVRKEFKSLSAAIDNLQGTMEEWVGKVKQEVTKNDGAKEPKSIEQKPATSEKSKEEPSMHQKFWDMVGHPPDQKTIDFINSLREN